MRHEEPELVIAMNLQEKYYIPLDSLAYDQFQNVLQFHLGPLQVQVSEYWLVSWKKTLSVSSQLQSKW